MWSAAVFSMFASLQAPSVGDPESTRRVYVSIVVLVVLGVAMTILAIWLVRRTRPEPELLAPLEAMETRRWRTSEPAEQARVLDAKRPVGATPLRRSAQAPKVDTEFGEVQPVRSFDDLAEAGPASGRKLPEPRSASERVDVDAGSDPTPLRASMPATSGVAADADPDLDLDVVADEELVDGEVVEVVEDSAPDSDVAADKDEAADDAADDAAADDDAGDDDTSDTSRPARTAATGGELAPPVVADESR